MSVKNIIRKVQSRTRRVFHGESPTKPKELAQRGSPARKLRAGSLKSHRALNKGVGGIKSLGSTYNNP